MTNFIKYALAAALSAAMGIALAQGRHDEKPHGTQGKPAAASDTPATERMPGRHDERPHGKSKSTAKKTTKKADAKKDETSK